jgi:rod shape-determining protein MreB
VAVISLGGLVVSQSVSVGGERIDEAIMNYLKRECNIIVGRNTAEKVKQDLATAIPL